VVPPQRNDVKDYNKKRMEYLGIPKGKIADSLNNRE
jgi:hypothetical protein